MPKTTQIRTYDVRPDRLEEWITKFHNLIVPLRHELGFHIDGSWIDYERSQHLWVMTYDGTQTFADANAAYWASPKRAALGIEPSDYLTAEESRTVHSSFD
ncbi:NIPSNAP family protein [Mangrovihabitans endophyticus]|uniref:NIPSNAP domain-containing protein n=1 Tax=Mangrovihabitans endophyticus TaxID=1751298 RepID=A0A8J3FRG6_9ACTN|nr:NIPSNAP family protein [Mangrovihabitans endophyticus]GGL15880.1 hypothetical protein GCM10012284_58140 [Mangrovihabitans endophyticus]